jgi:hypothetical protein
MVKAGDNVYLFYPNLIGYLRLAMVVYAFTCLYDADTVSFVCLYGAASE